MISLILSSLNRPIRVFATTSKGIIHRLFTIYSETVSLVMTNQPIVATSIVPASVEKVIFTDF